MTSDQGRSVARPIHTDIDRNNRCSQYGKGRACNAPSSPARLCTCLAPHLGSQLGRHTGPHLGGGHRVITTGPIVDTTCRGQGRAATYPQLSQIFCGYPSARLAPALSTSATPDEGGCENRHGASPNHGGWTKRVPRDIVAVHVLCSALTQANNCCADSASVCRVRMARASLAHRSMAGTTGSGEVR